MKKIFTILLFILLALTGSAQWQATKGTQMTYHEEYTGTILSITKTRMDLFVNTDYSYITEPTGFDMMVYDSLGHFVESFSQDYPNVQPGVCRKIYKYTSELNGVIDITIYGTMGQHRCIMSYTISIPTYRRQKIYEDLIKQMLR